MDKQTGKASIYPIENFRLVMEVNLVAPVYWALEMIARIAEERLHKGKGRWTAGEGIQGTVIFIGSISSSGIPGQVSYSATKAALEGVAATLGKEATYHGVRFATIHPGFTDTPMVRALGQEYIDKNIIPYTQLKRLIDPAEIADAIYFMICNSAVSGELWADAGWHPPGVSSDPARIFGPEVPPWTSPSPRRGDGGRLSVPPRPLVGTTPGLLPEKGRRCPQGG